MPSWSWPLIGRSCSAENQPRVGTDIELCVAGRTTRVSGRLHSSAYPLHVVVFAAAGSVVPPLATKVATAAAISRPASTGTMMRGTRRTVSTCSSASGGR